MTEPNYFRLVRDALLRARHSLLFIGWEFDNCIKLDPDAPLPGLPDELGPFLSALGEPRPGAGAPMELRPVRNTRTGYDAPLSAKLDEKATLRVLARQRPSARREIEKLHLAAIAAARRTIYIEGHYFAALCVGEADRL